jgi:predicted lipoprotein with Yx(FWY)xxD motif
MIRSGALRMFAGLAVAALVFAACGGDDSSNNSSSNNTTATTTKTSASGSDTVSIAMTKLGDTLVDSKGMTLYIFKSDAKGKSNCNAGCDSTWPPLKVTGAVKVGTGLDAEDFKTITRADGTKQVTDYGFPVYTYSGDTKAGDTNGDGIGNLWYAVGKEGKAAPKSVLASSSSETTTTTKPGY